MQTSSPSALEFLSFRLGNEEYGVDIQKVQELRAYTPVTAIANAPAFVKGVVNLRGVIVPIIDLRIKLGLATPTYDQFTVVIILFVGSGQVGVVVDSVSDVQTLTPEQIKPVPPVHASAGASAGANFVTGIGALDERMIILVDIELLLAGAEGVPSEQLAA
jgi:purine-binding chemotaxis protein CheW